MAFKSPSQLVVLSIYSSVLAAQKAPSKCDYEPTIEHVLRKGGGARSLKLPANGPVILESHYVTKEDKIKIGSLKNGTDRISGHLERSCVALKLSEPDCKKKYKGPYKNIWNGTDGGAGGATHAIGGTALHHVDKTAIPSLEEEMNLANIRWYIDKNLKPTSPPMGTKYLVRYKDKARVVAVGYEHGPPPQHGFLGLGPEAFDQLEIRNGNVVTFGRLKDQSLPLGPITCSP